jgi:hypothetical protein
MAQQVGVLLAYAEPASDMGNGYRTMWVVFSPTEARVLATVPEVIVPRSTGFWRIGSAIVCDYGSSDRWGSRQEILWQTPLEMVPVIELGSPCKSNRPDSDGSAESDLLNPDSNVCGRETATLLFVSPTHLAEQFKTAWDGCDGRGDQYTTRNAVRTLDNGQPISLDEFFGEWAAKAYSVAAKKGFAENSKEINCPEPDPEQYDLKSWAITHNRGRWLAAASLNEMSGGCAFTYRTDLALPMRVAGEESKAALWPIIAAKFPHLSDFYLSPLGDYAIIIVNPKYADYHIYAYSVKAGALGKQLAEITWDKYNYHPFVMAQWSSGRYVVQWTDTIQRIKDHPLRAPVL